MQMKYVFFSLLSQSFGTRKHGETMQLQSVPGGASQGPPVPFSEVGERFISAAPGRAAEKFLCEAQHQSHRSFRKVLITHFGEIFSPSVHQRQLSHCRGAVASGTPQTHSQSTADCVFQTQKVLKNKAEQLNRVRILQVRYSGSLELNNLPMAPGRSGKTLDISKGSSQSPNLKTIFSSNEHLYQLCLTQHFTYRRDKTLLAVLLDISFGCIIPYCMQTTPQITGSNANGFPASFSFPYAPGERQKNCSHP